MKKFIIALILCLLPTLVLAQSQRNPCSIVNVGTFTNCQPVGIASGTVSLPVTNANSFTRISTNTNTVIKAAQGVFAGISVNTAGVTSSATVYNNTTCTGAIIGIYSTLAQVVLNVGAIAPVGICVTTAGGTPADITILWQ